MRESGILMHITSLPGPYGIGTMGAAAYRMVDFLSRAGQAYWQILPLNPTGFGDSPYQALSSQGGNHYLIDLDLLKDQGLLKQQELESLDWGSQPDRVDFGKLYQNRIPVLETAYRRFRPDEHYRRFLEENQWWLEEYALFMAIKTEQDGKPWTQWPQSLRDHDPQALAEKARQLEDTVNFHKFLQYQFQTQWQALRAYAKDRGIQIIGDVPIYVPLDSADVWANGELFQLDENRQPVVVAGCPPDSFTVDGQLWGNPIYRWEEMGRQGYRWWIRRLEAAEKLYDVIRLDHFRGFESYWQVDAREKTARNGQWVKGPGMDFIRTIQKALPKLPFIAEDLGYVTQQVRQLQLDSGYPGMKVLEFAFDSREDSDYLPHLYPVDSVCYTGTHDNVTLKQWFDEASIQDIAYAKAYLGLNWEEGYVRGMIRGAMSSVSRLCVVQIQDYLELGKEARMNFPGTLSQWNWTWRAEPGFDSDALAREIFHLTQLYGRASRKPSA